MGTESNIPMSEKSGVKFSIVVVCLNAGPDLRDTINSITGQNYEDYEIIVKDGFSKDGSVEALVINEKIKLFVERDNGIYDAMNQAVRRCAGDYVYFLNCGDVFYDQDVLRSVSNHLEKRHWPKIAYGDYYQKAYNRFMKSPPRVTPFFLYRTLLCHQACFFARGLFDDGNAFDTGFKVFADYNFLADAVLKGKNNPVYIPVTVSGYKGGGFSLRKDVARLKRNELEKIRNAYFTASQRRLYSLMLSLTLPGLRGLLFTVNPLSFARNAYIGLVNRLYRK